MPPSAGQPPLSWTAGIRRVTGVSLFFASCDVMNLPPEQAYEFLISGRDNKGNEISEEDYRERGRSLASIFKAKIVDS